MASAEPFNRLVKLMARAFYDSIPMKGDNQPKNFRGDNSGMGVVVLDALTRRQWVREEDLAKALKLHSKQLRRILRFFEEEKLITRVHRKESAKAEKAHNSAAAAASGQPVAKEDEGNKRCTHIRTVAWIMLRYSAFDALQLEQLKPLVAQLEKVKKLPAPEFGSLQSWERARSDAFANGCPGATDSSMNSTTGPGNGFEVIIDPNKDVDVKDDPGKDGMGSKPMPPWLKEGKNLSEEQRGQIPSKLNEISETKDGNKQKPEDEKTIEDEYIKAYYEAWGKQEDAKRRMQHEGEIFISNSQSDRKVGMKYKWEDEDEGIEWKEDQATAKSNTLQRSSVLPCCRNSFQPQRSSPATAAAPSQPAALLPHRSSFPSPRSSPVVAPSLSFAVAPPLFFSPLRRQLAGAAAPFQIDGRISHPAQASNAEADWDGCGDRFLASPLRPRLG
ncbi:hypothetical protein PR202_ga00628 [Eleusine coracana subsp. coracana]|uniref:HTH TFE/IIEalpha-type domain-containing protein n=1 Tax=Eleusine coracana subsp. coracana TaxID=191504 RepID=A0AAV5BEH9_ELECO|nr:hypothetical protein PR202_ga00628 [Eleusine coracana subsp. coracana]